MHKHSFLTLSILSLFVILVPELAAAAPDAMGETLCRAYEIATGKTGAAVATLGVLTLGFMALIGRVQWGLVIIVVCGIAVIWAAPEMVEFVAGEGAVSCGVAAGG